MYKVVLSLAAVIALGLVGCGSDSDDTPKVVDHSTKTLKRIATVPAGAEVTGLVVNDAGELFFNAQHPGKKDEFTEGVTPAFIGYVKGMDINNFSGDSMAVPAEGTREEVHVAGGEYIKLGEAGQLINNGTQVLGGIYDVNGELVYVSNDVDFNSFVKIDDNSAYLYTGWEGAGIKGASSISRLKLNKVDGEWATDLATSKMIDLSSIKGGWILCFGHETPWDTFLTAEEYYYLNTALWNYPGHHDDNYMPYFIDGSTNITYHIPGTMDQYLGKFTNPYDYGYQIEMSERTSDEPKLVKHYAMGRFSHENGVVMADNKTVYQSDDDSAAYTSDTYNTNSGGVFFKFVADKAKDMSAGTLYAAKLTQEDGNATASASFKVEWLELAHGDNETIAGWIAEYDNITEADYVAGESSYISDADVQNWAEGKVNKDLNNDGTIGSYQDDRPAFLESRKAAAALGATYEWNKLEGITADKNSLYIAVSDIGYTMSSTWGDTHWSTGVKSSAGGDIAIDEENCGGVYTAAIDKNNNISKISPALIGETVASGDETMCHSDKIANPDNILTFSEDKVLIGEDSGDHGVDMLWLWQ
ncbi:MAG: DUF839 domain-containing protein [Epsilonproteobacteria bacterium]|nr:DUF839 domain-containing protein [Campylobacterota bacterium]